MRKLLYTLSIIAALAILSGVWATDIVRSSDGASIVKLDSGAPSTQMTSTRAGEQIKWQVISSGSTDGSSTAYCLKGTIGQPAVGSGSSAGYSLGHGFWQLFGSGDECCQHRGDINHSGSGPDISDLVFLVTYMFQGGVEPPCLDEADINGSGGGPDITDLVYLVTYMFQSGPAPVPCP
jgi:hypothetical protein